MKYKPGQRVKVYLYVDTPSQLNNSYRLTARNNGGMFSVWVNEKDIIGEAEVTEQ